MILRDVLNRVIRRLPGSWAAAIDLALWPEIRFQWGGPMNGQDGRLAMTREVIDAMDIAQIVETGTCRGTTTEWFAQIFNGPIHSVEYNRRLHLYSAEILSKFENVTLAFADSRVWLSEIARNPSIRERTTLFYLDAHVTGSSEPIAREVEQITSNWDRFAIVIDDVELPGYTGDLLGNGQRLTLDYVFNSIPDGLSVFTPTLPGEKESGKRRGCCVIVRNGDAGKLKGLKVVRPV